MGRIMTVMKKNDICNITGELKQFALLLVPDISGIFLMNWSGVMIDDIARKISTYHYNNTPMHVFAKNIDCGYTLEPPQSMF